MAEEEPLPEVRFAEYPQRSCRIMETQDGLIDQACALAEHHPGPCCPNNRPAIRRRAAWEAAHPGWEKMARDPDPFADFTKIPGVV